MHPYIDRQVYDFMNHVPNLVVVAEEVKKAGRLLMPCLCFTTGIDHTDDFYVAKVEEMVAAMGDELVLCLKNHSAVGSAKRITEVVTAIQNRFPELILAYHGHNTDGNDLARMVSAVLAG